MTESEFLTQAEQTLRGIAIALEQISDQGELDVECSRSGNVLEIEFIDTGSKIIINSQTPMREIWVAAKSGGFHYRSEAGKWVNTRDNSELFASLSTLVSKESGLDVMLSPGS